MFGLSRIGLERCDGLALTTGYDYDAVGNRIKIVDPKGSILYTDYDPANRKITEYFAAATGTIKANAAVKQGIEYYKNSSLKTVTSYDYPEVSSNTLAYTAFEYDDRGRVTKVTQAIDANTSAITQYAYSDTGFTVQGDSVKYQIKVTDAEGKLTYMAFDAFNRPIKTLYPSQRYEKLEYYDVGTLHIKTVFDSQGTAREIEHFYDKYSRLIRVKYPDDGEVHYTYDGFGRKIEILDNRNETDRIGGTGSYANKIAYTYDALDRIKTVTNQDGYQNQYAYRADGQKAAVEVFDPTQTQVYNVTYWFDKANRLGMVSEPLVERNSPIAAGYSYDANGNRTFTRYHFDHMLYTTQISYTFNRDNLLTGYTGFPTFNLNNVVVDGLGRLASSHETITRFGGNTVEHDYTCNYDKLSRLTYHKATNVVGTDYHERSYSYDKAGNRTSTTFNGETTDFTVENDLVTGATGGKGVTYDANGRQTSQLSVSTPDNTLVYDWDGKLREGYSGGNSVLTSTYTPNGIRIARKRTNSSNNFNHKYIVDPVGALPHILLVLDANNNNQIIKTYIHANDQIVCQHNGDARNTDIYYYFHDRLGSVRALFNTDCTVKNCYFYGPWGEVTGDDIHEEVTNPYGFAGYLYDNEIGQYHCNARQYDILLGRFTSYDPVRGIFNEPMALHRYLYSLNDPINKFDLSGKETIGSMVTAVSMTSVLISMAGIAVFAVFSHLRWGAFRGTSLNDANPSFQAQVNSAVNIIRLRLIGRTFNLANGTVVRIDASWTNDNIYKYDVNCQDYAEAMYYPSSTIMLGRNFFNNLHSPEEMATMMVHENFHKHGGFFDERSAWELTAQVIVALGIDPQATRIPSTLVNDTIISSQEYNFPLPPNFPRN